MQASTSLISKVSAIFAALSLAFFAVTGSAHSPAEPEQSTSAASSHSLAQGRGGFVFSNWNGPDLPVWTYVPQRIESGTAPILFVMHGARRDPQRYREQWVASADRGGFIIVAPEFSRVDFPGSRNYNLGGMFERGTGEWRDEGLWSFSAIEPIFDEVVARLNGSQGDYTIFGHSAGSQFVHRFLMMKPDNRAKRFLAANAGWYTFADPEIAFPFGLGEIPLTQEQLAAILAKDVVILLGDQDTDTAHSSLNRSDGAMRQGEHRFARGQAFFEAARAYADQNGWEFGWSLRVVEGVGHSNGGMAEGAFDLVD